MLANFVSCHDCKKRAQPKCVHIQSTLQPKHLAPNQLVSMILQAGCKNMSRLRNTCHAVPYMYLQTPWGPRSGPPPPKGTCSFEHLQDLEVVPHPRNMFPMLTDFDKDWLTIYNRSAKQWHIFTQIDLCSKGHVEVSKITPRIKRHKWGLGLPTHNEL